MSILLPDIDDNVAFDRINELQKLIHEVDTNLEELSSQRRMLQDKIAYHHHSSKSSHRRSLQTFLLTIWNGKLEPCDDMKSISKMLRVVDSRVQAILQRHKRLSFSLEIYKGVLAPISRIPSEILQEIFQHTLPSTFVRPSTRQSPLLLTTVCERWRSIALSTRSLWSSISTTSDWPLQDFLPQVSPSCSDKITRFVLQRPYSKLPSQPLLWIERAGQAPFYMEITIPQKDSWFGTTDPYYPWVVQTSERWFHLRLTARSVNLALLLAKPMPRLKSLELVGVYDRDYDIFMLRTHRAEFDLRPETYSFPWSSLTTLEAHKTWFIVDQLLVILKGSPNLQSCSVKVQDLYTVHEPPYLVRSRLNHSSLARFHVYMNDRKGYALQRLLDSSSLPSLSSFCISTSKENCARSDWPHNAFVAFVRRSACPLRTLCLTGFSMLTRTDTGWLDTQRISEIWACLPFLESFESI
ncbi:hypothetical protein D9756_007754 [Leucocoprinus leucothites]|uniref:F-box domain-containing protein n=1 Tax=Leucocoprinus leucothites TaxID=201217 RepID=A0A8H5FVZ1_9AGAR|nr:hypothetical protein D9756_007754 [Leucoagaricus leucothites]